MELGDLELSVLKAVRTLEEGTPGEIYNVLRKDRDLAYTSVTTTIYRLVDKGLLQARRVSKKKVFYSLKSDPSSARMIGGLMDRLLGAFGPSAISHLLEHAESLSGEDRAALRKAIEEAQARESRDLD